MVTSLACGNRLTYAVTSTGKVFYWGAKVPTPRVLAEDSYPMQYSISNKDRIVDRSTIKLSTCFSESLSLSFMNMPSTTVQGEWVGGWGWACG